MTVQSTVTRVLLLREGHVLIEEKKKEFYFEHLKFEMSMKYPSRILQAGFSDPGVECTGKRNKLKI